LKSCKIP